MNNNKQSSVDELCNSFYEESIDESNIPREHYEYEIKQLMIEFALYYKQTYKKDMMTNDKQSSVLWVVSKIDFMLPTYLIEQAKAMHKEEHGKTWDKSLDNLKARGMMGFWTYTDFDDYYNETFNTHEKNNKN